jgi:hypothetical protein
MTSNENWLSSLTSASHAERVTFGDDSSTSVEETSEVKVNNKFVLKDVALVKNLKYNLLSVSQMIDEDLEVCFNKNECKVLDSLGKNMFQISCFGRVFKADFDAVTF